MLQVKPDKPLSSMLVSLIRALDNIAKQLGISYFVIGATARDILMEHVYDIETNRATRDVDFAVAVASWEEFDRLKDELIATGKFTPGAIPHRLLFGTAPAAYPLDLVPFEGVEHDGEIAWPPEGKDIMNVAGYTDAYDSALEVEIEEQFPIKIVSLPAMVVLKVFAWTDRPDRGKHASDILLILRNYSRTGPPNRIWDEAADLLTAYDHEHDQVGAALLGRDVKRDVEQDIRAKVLAIFSAEKTRERFCAQMLGATPGGDIEHAMLLLAAFLKEI